VTEEVAKPTLSASRRGKRLTLFLGRQVIKQVRPERKRGGWLKVVRPQCSSKENGGGPTTGPRNSPAPGPQDLFQEEVLGAKADHCKGMSANGRVMAVQWIRCSTVSPSAEPHSLHGQRPP
jgi:hypothetical protein